VDTSRFIALVKKYRDCEELTDTISLNIITRLKRDEYVSLETIEKICLTLQCQVDDILDFGVRNNGHIE